MGIQEVRAYNTITVATKLLSIGLLGSIILAGAVSVENVFAASLIVLIASAVWTGWKLLPHLARGGQALRPSTRLFRESVDYGFKAYLAALFAFLVLRFDLLMVKRILGSTQAGYYSIAANMADLIYMLPVTIGMILFPKLSSMTDRRQMWQYAKRVAVIVGLLMFGLTAIALFLARPAVSLLYGQPFLPSVDAFVWLMPAIVLLSINTVLMNYFAAVGMPRIVVYAPAVATVLNVVLNMKLIPSVGIVGAAISSTIAYGCMLICSMAYLATQRTRYEE